MDENPLIVLCPAFGNGFQMATANDAICEAFDV